MRDQRSEVRGQRSASRAVLSPGIRRSITRHRRGFTLLEVMIVVGIIVILVGIVLAVGGTLASSQNIRRTQATMEILDRSLSEWKNLIRRDLTWGIDGQNGDGSANARAVYDMQEDTDHIFLITDMLDEVGRSSDIRTILGQIDQSKFVRYETTGGGQQPEWIREGSLASFQQTEPDPNAGAWDAVPWYGKHTVLDAWDRPIRVIHPGRTWTATDPLNGPDGDGTVRTPLEEVYGVARSGKPYFVSSGPDGRFGSLDAGATQAQQEAAQDNVYSEEVEEP